MTPEKVTTAFALRAWQQVITRVGNLCSQLNEDQLAAEVAPGRNRLIYIWGHLTAIHDAMFPILRLGERQHAELDLPFVTQPDKSVKLPAGAEIKRCWDEVHAQLLARFSTLTPPEWLERHGSVSAEDFDLDPTRNRLAILLNRTNHASYHLGQMMLTQRKDQ